MHLAKENIKKLSEKRSDIQDRAQSQNRALTTEEVALVVEMEAAIDEERKKLPVGSPLSLQFSGNQRSANSGNRPFKSFGEQLHAVMQAGIPGGQVDPRLHEIRASASGLNETVPSEGGFLVQKDFSTEILQDVFEVGKISKLCRRVPISRNANGIKIPGVDETSRVNGSRSGGTLAYWMAEAEEKTKSKPKFREIDLNLKKAVCLVYTTDELLQDSAALENFVRVNATQELTFALEDAIINGTGAGQPLGILNAGCLVTVAKESGQITKTILAENVVKMWSRLLPGSEETAVWLTNKNTLPQLLSMSIAVGTGGVPVYQPANALAGLPYQSLFSRPVIFCEQAATLGTVGDIILADLPKGYILAEKGGIQSDMSIHVRFLYDESVFRFVLRVDGQPVRAAALTPFKGGADDTQSHFIALQTR